jgi:hypothetical protein
MRLAVLVNYPFGVASLTLAQSSNQSVYAVLAEAAGHGTASLERCHNQSDIFIRE